MRTVTICKLDTQGRLYGEILENGTYYTIEAFEHTGGDKSKEWAFNFDDFGQSQLAKVREVEKEIGKDVFRSKGGIQRNNPDQLCLICQI